MEIKGWVRTSLIDYPEHIASVLFTGGCNYCCPMCHNADLVLHPEEMLNIPEQNVLSFLRKRVGLIDGLVVSGGEPTLQHNLIPFLIEVKKLGLATKLDTNGSRPVVVAEIVRQALVDYIAVDIKAPPDKYPLLTSFPQVDISAVVDSLGVIYSHTMSFELRTTVVPKLLNLDDINAIAKWLRGLMPDMADRGRYVLQQFRGVRTLVPELSTHSPYSKDQLLEMAETARRWLPSVIVRGI